MLGKGKGTTFTARKKMMGVFIILSVTVKSQHFLMHAMDILLQIVHIASHSFCSKFMTTVIDMYKL